MHASRAWTPGWSSLRYCRPFLPSVYDTHRSLILYAEHHQRSISCKEGRTSETNDHQSRSKSIGSWLKLAEGGRDTTCITLSMTARSLPKLASPLGDPIPARCIMGVHVAMIPRYTCSGVVQTPLSRRETNTKMTYRLTLSQ